MRLNGQWLHGSMLESADERRGVPVPTWIDIAPDLLQSGANLLEIEVAHDYRAGLSVLRLGPEQGLWRFHVRDEALQLTLASFAQPVRDRAGAVHHLDLVAPPQRTGARPVRRAARLAFGAQRRLQQHRHGGAHPGADVLFYLANVVGAMLLARFALAWAGRDWPWFGA